MSEAIESTSTTRPGGRPRRDRRLDAALVFVGGSAAVLAVVAALTQGLRYGIGASVGGAVAALNLWLIVRLGGAFVQGRKRHAAWGMLGALKLVALLALAFAVVRTGVIPPLAFLLGYAALPLGIVFTQFSAARPSAARFDRPPSW